MEINIETVAANRQMIDNFKAVVETVKSQKDSIDGSGDTLTAITEMVIDAFGTEIYNDVRAMVDENNAEAEKIISLLEAVIERSEQRHAMEKAVTDTFSTLGITGVKFV